MKTTSQAATSFSDVGDHHMEMLLDDVSSEVQEMKSADAPVENIATGDTECTTELNDSVRNYYYLCVVRKCLQVSKILSTYLLAAIDVWKKLFDVVNKFYN